MRTATSKNGEKRETYLTPLKMSSEAKARMM